MPTAERVADLIRHVEARRLVEALEAFYHPHSTMRENSAPPRIGRAASIERQRHNNTLGAEVLELRAASVLIDGDRAAIEWHGEWVLPDGRRHRIEEVALQSWEGDRILHERFFYDPRPLGDLAEPVE
jgi:hypothetical protein